MTPKLMYAVVTALALASTGTSPLAYGADYREARGRDDLGSPPPTTTTRKTARIGASTKFLTVAHGETVKIENEKGQSFVWTFDTSEEVSFPLEAIAPRSFEAGRTRVYVAYPPTHRGDR